MDTTSKKIIELKTQYPTIRVGDDINGYHELNANEYEAKIAEWAEAEINHEQKQIAEKNEKLAKIDAKKSAITKLEAFGLSSTEIAAIGFVISQEEQEFLDELAEPSA
jgi:Pyruvate/2-oxoacid:ferredoxin oxidoreductase gamma subunit